MRGAGCDRADGVLLPSGQLWTVEPDEARYAEIAREMLSTGNFILPHLDYVLYIEKRHCFTG
jgi:4-amino-4-deoxy-L-arabinose transferase-like glycosyltransferase